MLSLARLVQLLALFLHPLVHTRLLLGSLMMMLKLLKPLMERRAFHCVEKEEAWVQVLRHNMVLELQIVFWYFGFGLLEGFSPSSHRYLDCSSLFEATVLQVDVKK